MHRGYVKIWRKIEDSFFYKKSEYVHLWVHLLLRTNHAERRFMFNGEQMVCKRGQVVTSLTKLSLETGVHRSVINRILKCFQIETMIETINYKRFTLISILNYELHQGSIETTNETNLERQRNDKETIKKRPLINNNNNNKENKEKKGENLFSIPSERVKEGLDKGSDTLKDKDKDILLLKKKEKKDGITPTLEQVTSFCSERENIVDPHKFFNHYESNGWKVGRNPMKNWKAAVITWERSEFGNNGKKGEQNGNQYPHE